MKVAFVSCVKLKADSARPARHLYVSPWFVGARRYAERNAHGLRNARSVSVTGARQILDDGGQVRHAWRRFRT